MKQSSPPNPIPGYITTAQAAERSGLDQETVAHYLKPQTRNGITHPPRLNGFKIGSIWLVDEKSFEEYLKTKPKRGRKPNKK